MSKNYIDPVELALRATSSVGEHTKTSSVTNPVEDEAVKQAKLRQAATAAFKFAEQHVSNRVQDQEDALAGLSAAVEVHSKQHALCRFKVSMARGKCWLCGINDPDPTSVYLRCFACDEARLKNSFPLR